MDETPSPPDEFDYWEMVKEKLAGKSIERKSLANPPQTPSTKQPPLSKSTKWISQLDTDFV